MTGSPRLLLVGGGGGLVGRSLLERFRTTHRIRSLHRHPVPREAEIGVEWVPADLLRPFDWAEAVRGVDLIVNVAWYRSGPAARFVRLREGLDQLLEAARSAGVPRFVQISVPPAPERLESSFPYLTEKRRFDRALAASGLSYRILRPSMLFGRGDVLLGVMRRTLRRWSMLPMFGDGRYRVSPLSVEDLADIVVEEEQSARTGTSDLGGPSTYRYRELTDLLFRAEGRTPRYWRMSPSNGFRLARLLEFLGSDLLYEYEVEWLVSDMLGLAPWPRAGPLRRVEEYLRDPANR